MKLGIELLLKGSLKAAIQIFQGPNEAYADFLARLEVAISYSVIGEEAIMQLGKLLAYENANQEYQRAITPIHETGTVIDYLKAYHNLGSETQKMQILAKTMAAAFKREMKDILHVGTRPIYKGISLKGTQEKLELLEKPPGICLRAIQGYIGPGNLDLKYDIEGKPISGNSKLGTPRVPINKTQGQTPSFPSNPQHPAVLQSIYPP